MSRASDLARERLGHYGKREPTIDPTDPVNRAKQSEGIPTRDTNPLNPSGVALVNGMAVEGADTPYTPLPDELTQAARDSLEKAELTTLKRVSETSDENLLALDNIGPATLKLLREAAK